MAQELRDEFDIDVRVLGIVSSSRMLLSDSALDLSSWRHQFEQCAAFPCPPAACINTALDQFSFEQHSCLSSAPPAHTHMQTQFSL